MIRFLLAALLFATPARAIEPQRREVTVISARAWDGYQYKEVFLPSNAPTLTLMSGRDSAIAFVRTQEYYWPLSRQVYVDFERQREPIAGVLRIEQNGAVVAELAQAPYAVVYPEGAINGDASLLWGEAALAGFAAHEQSEHELNRRFVQAQRAHAAYEQALLAAAGDAGVVAIDPPPPLPRPSLRLVTPPTDGFRVQLDPGDYRIVLARDGQDVPGTRRALRVIAADGRAELVADVIPEERWTRPLAANSEAARIYARAGSTFYLTLAEASRFDEQDYLAIVSPQATAQAGRPMWVRRRPDDATVVQMVTGDGAASQAPAALKVDQTSASGFGYVVRPARPGEAPDLMARTITLPTDGDARLELAVPSRAFRRDVVVVGPRHALPGFLLALLPAVAGVALGFVVRSSRRGRRPDVPSGAVAGIE